MPDTVRMHTAHTGIIKKDGSAVPSFCAVYSVAAEIDFTV